MYTWLAFKIQCYACNGPVQLLTLPAESVCCQKKKKLSISVTLTFLLLFTTEVLSLTPGGKLVLRTQENEKAFLTSLG